MDSKISNLIIYGNSARESVLGELADVCAALRTVGFNVDELTAKVYSQVRRILEVGTDYAFDKNLWQNYLTYVLITSENPFTLTCEKTGAHDGSVNRFALHDCGIFRELFHYDFSWIEERLGIDCFDILTDYKAIEKPELMYNGNVSEKVRELSESLANAQTDEEFFELLTGFYRDYGVGMYGLNRAFRIRELPGGGVELVPVANMDPVRLDALVGYENQKAQLIANTESFVAGHKANNVLLFGDSGTGKSTSIKAIVNEYYDRGLRMIEIYKHQFRLLSQLIAQIKNRNYKFVIYMDDLSFEDDESEYKYLKAVIEGGVETRPDNVLIYATSNRRHLIREMWSDRSDMEGAAEVHRSDTMEEKLSLAYRFGVTISYYKPNREQYHTIVKELAARAGLNMIDEQLFLEADRWEMRHSGLNGRTATQFINHLMG